MTGLKILFVMAKNPTDRMWLFLCKKLASILKVRGGGGGGGGGGGAS